jgi:hypothetical protein
MMTAMRVALMSAAVACTAVASAQPAMTADAKEIANYRLSMEGLNKVAVAMRSIIGEMKKDPRFQEALTADAEIKALEKKGELTAAEQQRIEQLRARKEELSKVLSGMSMGNADTLSDMEAQIRKVPQVMAGLRVADMTPRDYAKFMLTMLQASMVAGLKKHGVAMQLPIEVAPENVKFIEEHEAELKALQEEWKALSGGQ